MGENSKKKKIDFEYDKTHRHGQVNGTKQNVIAKFRSHQYSSDLYYARKKNKNRNIRSKPSLTKKRTELLRNATERIEDNSPKAYSSFTLISMETLKLD